MARKLNGVSVIIPCLNEEKTIKWVVEKIPNLPWSYEIIVVDDGSTDNTTGTVKSLGKKFIKVVSYKPNRGKGHALRKGIETSTMDVVVIQDADMNPEKDLEEILKPIFEGKADFVNGTRFVYPMEKGAMKLLHIPGNKAFAMIVSMLTGYHLTDTLCGYKAFLKNPLKKELNEDSWPDFELLLKAAKKKLRLVEVPVHYNKRHAGKSKMKTFKHGWNMLSMLVRAIFEK